MSRRRFGETWWGHAWVSALEGRASLDPNRLPRGRAYARQGTVSELGIAAGEVTADVWGTRPRPYRVRVRVRMFDRGEWDRVLDAIAGQLGHAAALLDGELPAEVAADAERARVDLLPGPGDVQPRCSCPDAADPCKHAAAVCYLVADTLDADPFALFLLRGRGRDELLAGLRARRRRVSEEPAVVTVAPDAGVDPRVAFARELAALPAVPVVPAHPGRPAVLPVDPPEGCGVHADELVALAADAAERAWQLTTGRGDGGLSLDRDGDLARRAAGLLGEGGIPALARAAGLSARELARWGIAWREAGAGGLAALRTSWQPAPVELRPAREVLDDSTLPGATTVWRNRVSRDALQLRLGEDRLWYRFVRAGTEWLPDGPAAARPVDLLQDTVQQG
ncbi:MAG: SWIM zinc finger family protein [Sciscionella sp.]